MELAFKSGSMKNWANLGVSVHVGGGVKDVFLLPQPSPDTSITPLSPPTHLAPHPYTQCDVPVKRREERSMHDIKHVVCVLFGCSGIGFATMCSDHVLEVIFCGIFLAPQKQHVF